MCARRVIKAPCEQLTVIGADMRTADWLVSSTVGDAVVSDRVLWVIDNRSAKPQSWAVVRIVGRHKAVAQKTGDKGGYSASRRGETDK